MSRIEDLERRLAKDPNSKVFAQLGEEYRKAGRLEDAVNTCRQGLENHPTYFSARVALGRALFESGSFEEASQELETVLGQVPDNILANKFLGETYLQLGRFEDALAKYRVAQMLAPEDTELALQIDKLERQIAEGPVAAAQPPRPPESAPPEPTPLVEEEPPDFDRYELEPTLVETEPSTSISPEPEGEQVFEFEDSGGEPIQPIEPEDTERRPSTLVGRQAAEIRDVSESISDEAQAIQEEIERRFPTGVVKRQAREIQDSVNAPTPFPGPIEPPPVSAAGETEPVDIPSIPPSLEVTPPPPLTAEPPPIPTRPEPGVLPALGEKESVEAPPTPGEPVREPEAQTNVPTATLGELYASQGHLEEALKVYRQLLASQPSDPKLRQRVEELTILVQAKSEAPAPPSSQPEGVSEGDERAVTETIHKLEGWLAAIRRS
jgi:tetratricopeptide (TPR) repeat protein